MRTFLLIANAAVALLFAVFFVYTFLGRRHLDGVAREFVTAKTQAFIVPAVDSAEEALRSEFIRRLLTKDQLAAAEAELTEFRSEPGRYIQRLTSTDAPPKPETFLAKVSERIYGWKERIRSHYNKVLQRLVSDLRIFSGSNAIAACLAFACAWRSPVRPPLQLTLISALLLAAIGLGVYFYADHLSFFTILFDSYLGWWYPVMIAVLFVLNYFDHVSPRKTNAA